MDSRRWEQIQTLFHELSDLPPGELDVALKLHPPEDQRTLRQMIEQDRKQSLLDRSLEAVADAILGDQQEQRQIGPYRIEALIGEGGMGRVFLAYRADLDSRAAIKILRDAWISPARRERFLREQRTLASLNHPHIARLLDADTLPDGTPYFVMEYVEGKDLIAYSRSLDIRARLALFRQVCVAVQFAHQQAILHRDIKPSNILVTATGVAKLLDFGISKQLDEIEATRTGLSLMTPAYASPEQLRGESLGVRSDVYSLGIVLGELLADTSSEDLRVLCSTAKHLDIDKRYASAEALVRDIDHYLRGEPLEARPDTLGYRLQKFIGRNRAAVLVASVALVAVLALVTFFLLRLSASRDLALAEAARAQRIQRFMLNLFDGGDKESGPAKDLNVATLIERGAQAAKVLDRDPAIQAEIYQTLGDINTKLGNWKQADALFDAADRSVPNQPGNLIARGLLRIDQAKLEEAESLIRRGLADSQRTLPPGHPAIAEANDALGRALEEKGKYDEAIRVLEESVRLRSAGPEADLAGSLYELANVHFYAGHYAESQALNQRVLAMRRKLFGDRHPSLAEVFVNLGAIEQDRGNYPQAETYHRQALAITRDFYGDQHYRTAAGLTMVARAVVFQNRPDEATTLLNQALAVQERVFGPVHPRVASALNEVGNVAMRRARYDEARAAFSRAAAIYEQIYSGKHYLIGIAKANVASAYLAEKNNKAAEVLFREAIAMYGQTLAPDHLNCGITRIKLGRALLRQQRYQEALTESSGGYEILKKQASPAVGFLQNARADLAEIHLALNQPERAAAYKQEWASVAQTK